MLVRLPVALTVLLPYPRVVVPTGAVVIGTGTSVVPSAEDCVSLLQSQLAVAVMVSFTVLGTTTGAVYDGTLCVAVDAAGGVKTGRVLSVSRGTEEVVHGGVVVLVLVWVSVSLMGVAVVVHSVVCCVSVVWCLVTLV